MDSPRWKAHAIPQLLRHSLIGCDSRLPIRVRSLGEGCPADETPDPSSETVQNVVQNMVSCKLQAGESFGYTDRTPVRKLTSMRWGRSPEGRFWMPCSTSSRLPTQDAGSGPCSSTTRPASLAVAAVGVPPPAGCWLFCARAPVGWGWGWFPELSSA